MNPIRGGAVQAGGGPGDVGANVAPAARLVGQAAGSGATVVVLPELFLSAYHPPALTAQPATDLSADADRAIVDPRLDPLRVAAREHRAVVVAGAPVRHADGRRTCSSLVVDRSGTVTAAYDK